MNYHELIEGVICKNPVHQKKLFEKYYGLMFTICCRYASDRDEAKDFLQDGFVKIFRNIKKFDNEAHLVSWMKTVMINNSIDIFRKNSKFIKTEDEIEYVTDSTIPNVYSDLECEYIMKAIQKLPEGYRLVFNLYEIEGYSHKEVGEKLGINENTSKSQLHWAKKYLRKLLV